MTSGIHVDPVAFDRVSDAFRAGDKVLRRRVGKAFRDVAKPLGMDVIRKGAARLPHRGGLAERVASGGKISATISTGSSPMARLSLTNREGMKLAGMDSGELRHPVYARTDRDGSAPWVSQQITPHAFTDVFESESEVARVRDEALSAMDAALREIAGDAT